jgi:hypothetical protein
LNFNTVQGICRVVEKVNGYISEGAERGLGQRRIGYAIEEQRPFGKPDLGVCEAKMNAIDSLACVWIEQEYHVYCRSTVRTSGQDDRDSSDRKHADNPEEVCVHGLVLLVCIAAMMREMGKPLQAAGFFGTLAAMNDGRS